MIYGHIPPPTTYELRDEIATLRSQLAAAEARADRLADALRMIADGRVLSRSFTHAEVVAAYQKHARAALAEGEAG